MVDTNIQKERVFSVFKSKYSTLLNFSGFEGGERLL
jgi:hypothetical protein